jgi:hypothetical protein
VGGIDEEFGRGEISHWCAFVAWIVDAIAANSAPTTLFIFFLRLIIAAYAAIGGVFVSWNMQFGVEKACVSVQVCWQNCVPKCACVCPFSSGGYV